jgi:serine/threonine-protein kinase
MQSVVSGAYPPTLETQQRPPVVLEDTRDLDPEPAPRRTASARGYAPVLAVVVGLLVVIVVGLRTFGSPGSATIRFSTDPHDAIVTVDGKPATSSSSPFVIAGLSTEVEHTITVSKPGFSQWSTRLRVHDTKVLDLPAITLEPQPGASPEPPKNDVPPEPVQEIAAPAPLPRSPPVAKPSTPKPPPSPTETHRQKPTSGATSSGTSSSHAAASGGGSGGRGTLRVNSRPWSRVFIDGKLIGNTPQMSILLPAGSHKLKLVNPEFKLQKTVTINIAAGQIVTQVITLQ